MLLAITLTQATKMAIKKFVKLFTKKEGNDKMKKLKEVFSKLGEKLKNNIVVANKISITGWVSVVMLTLEGTDVISVLETLPTITLYGTNVMPYIYYFVLGFLSLFGVANKGFETLKQFNERKAVEQEEKKAEKEKVAREKEIKKIAQEKLIAHEKELKEKAVRLAEQEYEQKMNQKV